MQMLYCVSPLFVSKSLAGSIELSTSEKGVSPFLRSVNADESLLRDVILGFASSKLLTAWQLSCAEPANFLTFEI